MLRDAKGSHAAELPIYTVGENIYDIRDAEAEPEPDPEVEPEAEPNFTPNATPRPNPNPFPKKIIRDVTNFRKTRPFGKSPIPHQTESTTNGK